jgi:hypothetical protein
VPPTVFGGPIRVSHSPSIANELEQAVEGEPFFVVRTDGSRLQLHWQRLSPVLETAFVVPIRTVAFDLARAH